MIRKLIAGLALVGVLAVGGASAVSAETSDPSTGSAPAQTDQQRPAQERRCARATRLVSFLEKWQNQLDARIQKLQAKQTELAQTDPDKAARLGEAIAKLQHRSSELKEYTEKIAAGVAEKCPATS